VITFLSDVVPLWLRSEAIEEVAAIGLLPAEPKALVLAPAAFGLAA
jgi:hypothetical protein